MLPSRRTRSGPLRRRPPDPHGPTGHPDRPAGRRRAAHDGAVPVDDLDVAQDPGGGLRRSRRRCSRRCPSGRTTPTCGTPCRSRILHQLSQAGGAQHDRPADQLLDGGVRLRGAPLPVPRAALRPPAGHADHPVPGRPRPELHPVPVPAAPVEHERQLDRDPGAAVGRGVPRRRLRDVPAPPVLPGDPARARRCGRVDGANPWQIYRHIYLPLSKPALATLAIFTFMWSWNDFINPIIYLRDIDIVHADRRPVAVPGPVRRAGGRCSWPALSSA